jgi:hypothetical protein
MAMPVSYNRGGTTVTPAYGNLASVYSFPPSAKQPRVTRTNANLRTRGARWPNPVAFDGEAVRIRRSPNQFRVTGNGTSGATNQTNRTTTTSGAGTGLTVNLTAAGGVVTAAAPGSTRGFGYRIGDTITISTAQAGTGTAVTLVVTGLD